MRRWEQRDGYNSCGQESVKKGCFSLLRHKKWEGKRKQGGTKGRGV